MNNNKKDMSEMAKKGIREVKRNELLCTQHSHSVPGRVQISDGKEKELGKETIYEWIVLDASCSISVDNGRFLLFGFLAQRIVMITEVIVIAFDCLVT